MIYTTEPSNVFYVYLTAYRGYRSEEVNEVFLKGMTQRIVKHAGLYGHIESFNIAGMFKEAGADKATQERTLKVMCRTEKQAAELTYMACKEYDQDAVLVVRSQTHTAELWSIEMQGDYPYSFPQVKTDSLNGTLQQVDAPNGECYSVDDAGNIWEVIA